MAKPGSNGARRIAGGVDLSAAKMTDEQAWEAQFVLEQAAGMRCDGCGRRIGLGLRFTQIAVTDPREPVITVVACSREDCDFGTRAAAGATVAEQVEFAWMDGLGVDAPVSKRWAAAAAAREKASQPAD